MQTHYSHAVLSELSQIAQAGGHFQDMRLSVLKPGQVQANRGWETFHSL